MSINFSTDSHFLAARQTQSALMLENTYLDGIEEQLDQIEEREQMQYIRSNFKK